MIIKVLRGGVQARKNTHTRQNWFCGNSSAWTLRGRASIPRHTRAVILKPAVPQSYIYIYSNINFTHVLQRRAWVNRPPLYPFCVKPLLHTGLIQSMSSKSRYIPLGMCVCVCVYGAAATYIDPLSNDNGPLMIAQRLIVDCLFFNNKKIKCDFWYFLN